MEDVYNPPVYASCYVEARLKLKGKFVGIRLWAERQVCQSTHCHDYGKQTLKHTKSQ